MKAINPSAFPTFNDPGSRDAACGHIVQGGMTLRDYFAAAALQGMLAYSHVNPMHGNYHENCTSAQVAEAAYALANAMLAERAKDF